MYRKFVKRLLDVTLALTAVIVLSPLFLIIAVLVKIKLGSPVIFKQKRPGKGEKIFCMYKFRTMTDQKDAKGNLLSDEERLTSFGKKLRSTSLDELPELFNIVKGDMSIVGPRPLLVEYLPVYSERERKRHMIRGGLTGLAQVNGRNFLPWPKRLELDVQYVENVSFLMDCKIIKETIFSIIRQKDIAVDTDKVEGNLAELRNGKEI
ncbi:MAG: sugar transferase [Lachnospiraceae bacterium]|jgi:undecaprenyl phosphate N,N'-diacetylbacillosamine 1-phosphate transferase|nr:sugar transferase [Lachnospiraceae bacterium]